MDTRTSAELTILLGACAMFSIQSAFAREVEPPRAKLEEIVVTAQKRTESLQDTPISMAALTSVALENKGISNIADLRSEVPSLQISPAPVSATSARVFIRGVGNNDDQITQDPSVAVYFDGVYMARIQGLAMEVGELERIEVLRGPQGSLYGRNATGGAINYITRAPDLGEFGVKQSLTYGNYDQFRSRTRVNIPLGSIFAVELGYLHAQKDGFVKNPGTGVDRWGDQRRDAYRAAARLKPTDAIDVRYSYDRSDLNDTPPFIAGAPFYPAVADRPSAGSPFVRDLKRGDVTAQGHNLTASWDVTGNFTAKSITGYRKLKSVQHQNYLTGALGPFPVLVVDFDQWQKQFSQEIQAIGNAMDGRLEYVLGAYYFDESGYSFDFTRLTGRPRLDRAVTIDNTAFALYGQTTFRPTFLEGLYVTPSLRWSRDERKATLEQTRVPAVGAPIVAPTGRGDKSSSDLSPGLVAGYEVSDDINVYAKWARGYKSGGYNVRASTIPRFNEGFDEETLDAFEIGLKSSWLDDRLQLNVAGFYSDYQDIQVNVQTDPVNPGITDTFNAGEATIKGVELDLTARPVPALTVGLSYAYLDAGYDKIVDPITGNNIADRFNFVEAPDHAVTASLQYHFPETPIGALTAYVDYFMQSRKLTAPADPRYITGDHGLLDARLTLADIPLGFGKWRLSAFGKNLTDKEYYSAHFNAGLPGSIFGEPRTYGLELTLEFDTQSY